jgi:hypothetical protein
MNSYEVRATNSSGVTVDSAIMHVPLGQDPVPQVKLWADRSGAVGWSLLGPLGTDSQAFRSGLVK